MSRWSFARRFDVLEVLLVTAFAAVGAAVFERHQYADIAWVAQSAAQEGARLKDRYGPNITTLSSYDPFGRIR